MSTTLQNIKKFLTFHLDESEMTYIQHLARAIKVSMMMIGTGILTFFHAFFPCFFSKAASKTINKLSKLLQ